MEITAAPEGTMTIEQLAELILAQSRARLTAQGYHSQVEGETVQVIPGRVYTKIDRGPAHNMSGMLMVENATGIIYGIKGYGKVHKGHRYGTLATVAGWYWGDYYPRQLGMQVTIVHTSDQGARVHKAGCADVRRTELRRHDYISHYSLRVDSRDAAVRDAWADFLAEDMTMDTARGYTDFLPCCAALPAEAPAA